MFNLYPPEEIEKYSCHVCCKKDELDSQNLCRKCSKEYDDFIKES